LLDLFIGIELGNRQGKPDILFGKEEGDAELFQLDELFREILDDKRRQSLRRLVDEDYFRLSYLPGLGSCFP
jgi:hypothetical protein